MVMGAIPNRNVTGTIFVTWQLRVTLDSIRNSCDVYSQNWLLSLVLLTVVPAMAVMGGIIGKIMTAAAKDEMDIYGKVAEIFFSSGKKVPNKAHDKIWLVQHCRLELR